MGYGVDKLDIYVYTIILYSLCFLFVLDVPYWGDKV